jgi:hypothetical protein
MDLRRRSDVVDDGFNRLVIDDHCRHGRRLGVHHNRSEEGNGSETSAGSDIEGWICAIAAIL